MDETASTAEAVARTKPIMDRIAGIVRGFGCLSHLAHPHIRIVGEPRYPNAPMIQIITCEEVLMRTPSAAYCILSPLG